MSQNGQPDLKVFDTGAVRSTDAEAVDYTLISPIALRALAETCAYEAKKYQPYNAERGMGARDLLNHALKHIYDFLEGKRDEEDLAHAMWNVGMAIHSLSVWPHLNGDLRRQVDGQPCVPPTVDDETARSWARARRSLDSLREENVVRNLDRLKRDVKDAAAKATRAVGRVVTEDIHCGDCVVADDGGAIVKLPRAGARVPTKYYVFGALGRLSCQKDLEDAGHEISSWLGDFGLQSCDVAIVFSDNPNGPAFLDHARRYGKPVVLIGDPLHDFPRHGQPEKWFPNWQSFLASLETPAHAPSAR